MTHRRSQSVFLAVIASLALVASLGLSVALQSGTVATPGSHDPDAAAVVAANGASARLLDPVEPAGQDRAAHASGPVLIILDRESLTPLTPSTLVITPRGRAPMQLRGSGPWSFDLELCGRCEIRASAPGHVPLAGSFELAPGENRILMPCAGDLRVVLRDGSGAPVSGVELVLIAPSAAGPSAAVAREVEPSVATLDGQMPALVRTAAGWTPSENRGALDGEASTPTASADLVRSRKRATDAAGCAVWSDLAPLAGYRWAVATPRHVEVSPPHEQRRFEEVSGELRVSGSSAPEGVSGRFEIAAGLCLELSGTLVSGASVHGEIASSSAPARVVLYRVEQSSGTTAERGVSFESKHVQLTAADGAFEFADVQPGTWMLRAWWLEHDSDLHFAAQAFELTPGSRLDLGTIAVLAGAALDVTIGLQDPAGKAIDPIDVYSEIAPFAQLSIEVMPADGDASHLLSGLLPLPFGKSFRVHGLQPGRVYVCAQPGPGLVLDARRVSRVDGAQPAPFDVGARDSIELALVAHVGRSRPLVVSSPDGEGVIASAVWVHDLETRRVWLARTRTAPDALGGEECALTLPDGTYDLWCKLTIDSDRPEGLVGSVRATFGAGQTTPVQIALRRGARISGVVRDADGRPAAGRTLAWSCEDWPLGADALPLYSATTDERGVFELREVPPGTRLWGEAPGTDMAAFDAGAHAGVEIVTRW